MKSQAIKIDKSILNQTKVRFSTHAYTKIHKNTRVEKNRNQILATKLKKKRIVNMTRIGLLSIAVIFSLISTILTQQGLYELY